MKPAQRPLTARRLRRVLSYNPRTGLFRCKIALSRRNHIGDVAGHIDAGGYLIINIDGLAYKAGRLAWLHFYGKWPKTLVDHKNTKRDDNRLRNLREANNSQNSANSSLQKNNRSGFKGVSRSTPISNRWKAAIRKDGKRHHLGYFSSAEKAHAAYVVAAKRFHGEFARTA